MTHFVRASAWIEETQGTLVVCRGCDSMNSGWGPHRRHFQWRRWNIRWSTHPAGRLR